MKNFKTIVFTSIALAAFVLPMGCQVPRKSPPRKAIAVAKPRPEENIDLKLLKAAHGKDLDTVKNCVKKGGNVNVKDPSGWSAAMWAVWHWFDDKALCAYIMHSGGSFSQHEKDNLLERAARSGDCERAAFFLRFGANPNYVNAFGENCATLALRYFRGQYGIAENDAALPRYGNIEEVNAAVKLNVEEAGFAEKRLAEVQKVAAAYKERAEMFAKSPQENAEAMAKFEARELELAQAFYREIKDLGEDAELPESTLTAAQIYSSLTSEASEAKDAAEKNLQYVKFIALLKNSGANMRVLLAGAQDDSGKQNEWKGQQDKWTMDALARRGVRDTFPHVVDGLWDGELALIQLIGRGESIFNGQILRSILPLPKEYFFEFFLKNSELDAARTQGEKAVSELILAKAKQSRTVRWSHASARAGMVFGGAGAGDYATDFGGWLLGASTRSGSLTFHEEATQEEKERAFRRGGAQGEDVGRYLGAMELVMNGNELLAKINAGIEAQNAIAREHNAKLWELYEEFPFEGELAEKWKGLWERRVKRQEVHRKVFCERVKGVLSAEVLRLERSLEKASVSNVSGGADVVRSYHDAEADAEQRFEEETERLEKIRSFLASDFFQETSLEELLANPPHPREADPEWYAQNCLGKLKDNQVFTASAKALLDYGVDVNARANGTDHPALVCAYLWDKPEFEKLLLDYGADKKLALFHICERNDFDLLKKLLPRIDSLADVPEDGFGNTILHRAILAGRADMIPEIVKRGVYVDSRNKHGDTALHLAAEREDEACIIALLKLGASVNAKDKDSRIPSQRFWSVPSPKITQIFAEAHKRD